MAASQSLTVVEKEPALPAEDHDYRDYTRSRAAISSSSCGAYNCSALVKS
jgi:hypothetical protein